MNTRRHGRVVGWIVLPVMTLLACLAGLLGGCVERTLTINSDPPGALVYLNDQEVGRTPLKREFTWYGWYDVAVRMEGYKTLKTSSPVVAPAWLWVPFDLVAELLPFPVKDQHRLHYKLEPETEEDVDPQTIIARGQALRGKLEGKGTPAPATKPATTKATTTARSRPTNR
jgi:hypothetical protein